VREGMVLQGERPKGSVPGATTRPGSGNRSSALFGDKVVTSTIVTYDIDQPSLAWWPREPELRRGRAWREEPPCRATQTLHGADDVAGSTSFRIGCGRSPGRPRPHVQAVDAGTVEDRDTSLITGDA
jgi:hypothetical protein